MPSAALTACLFLYFQWSLRLRSLWKMSWVTSPCQRWRAKKGVFNTPSPSNKPSTSKQQFVWKNWKKRFFFWSVTSVQIMELNLTHADLQFVPGVGLLFGVQNSSITLSLHRQILYWLLWVHATANPTPSSHFPTFRAESSRCGGWRSTSCSDVMTWFVCSAMTQATSTLLLKASTSTPSSIWSGMTKADSR